MSKRSSKHRVLDRPAEADRWMLSVFVVSGDPTTARALDNLERLCKERLSGRHTIDVVNIDEDPAQADEFDIVVTPTVIRRHPSPERRIIGDLSATERVVVGLALPDVARSSPSQPDSEESRGT